VPELKFSLAKIILFLLKYKKALEEAVNNIEQLTSTLIGIKSKSPRRFEDAKLKDT
jgi:hypothetical protein